MLQFINYLVDFLDAQSWKGKDFVIFQVVDVADQAQLVLGLKNCLEDFEQLFGV